MSSINLNQVQQLLQKHNLTDSSNKDKKENFKPLNVQNINTKFNYLSYDSRQIKDNTLLFCKGNFNDKYLKNAKEHGVKGIITTKHRVVDSSVVEIIVTNVEKALSIIAAAFYGYPQDKLFIIGITGTKGKTTTAYFVRNSLQKSLQSPVGLFSTINTVVGRSDKDHYSSHLTTPESLDLFRNMRKAVDNGIHYLVMEVSSQAYKRNRVYGLKYDLGIFLNISPDHIGRNEHPNFADYLYCKEQLLVNSKQVLINQDTDNFNDLFATAKRTTLANNIYTYARIDNFLGNNKQALKEKNSKVIPDFEFKINTQNVANIIAITNKAKNLKLDKDYVVGIAGDYNVSNAVAAIIATKLALKDGKDHLINTKGIAEGIKDTRVPGRMEEYKSKEHGDVYVDYAHNYASLKALLKYLKSTQLKSGKVTVVLGSTGDKGISRRSGFGKALSEEADQAILTTDDPGFEDPLEIAKEIDNFVDHSKVQTSIELDRKKAIWQALKGSSAEDLVVIAGRGRDNKSKVKGKNVPYDTDTHMVEVLLEKLQNNDNK